MGNIFLKLAFLPILLSLLCACSGEGNGQKIEKANQTSVDGNNKEKLNIEIQEPDFDKSKPQQEMTQPKGKNNPLDF